MPILYLSYVNLTPGLENRFSKSSHKILIEILRKTFMTWKGFFDKYPEYSLGYFVATKRGVEQVDVKGPTVFKKKKGVDYVIYLPDTDYTLKKYIELVFEGIGISLKKYGVDETEIAFVRKECERELGLLAE